MCSCILYPSIERSSRPPLYHFKPVKERRAQFGRCDDSFNHIPDEFDIFIYVLNEITILSFFDYAISVGRGVVLTVQFVQWKPFIPHAK